MKKFLIIALMLAVSSCAKNSQEVETTGFSSTSKTQEVKKVETAPKKQTIEQSFKKAENYVKYELNQVGDLVDTEYKYAVKGALKEKIAEKNEISELFEKIKEEEQAKQQVATLKPEAPTMEAPVEELKPLKQELSLTDKLYNVTIKPIRKQLLKWNMYINKEVPKYMKQLKNEPSFWAILVALFAAFVYGIIHTLGPGHGKMVIATYFLTQQATIWQGIWLGIQTAFAHVGGAIVLVLVTDIALRSIILDPAKHMYLLKNISFGLIVLVGAVMLVLAILHMLGIMKKSGCSHCDGHHHHHGHHHSKKPTKREAFVALAIGCIPCTGSLLILLYAMAHDMLVFGLVLVVFVALGMALTMIIIGLLALYGKKKLLDKYVSGKHGHRYSNILELIGAVFIIAIGLLLLSVNL
tara:strand:+ start:1013 stop:2242 length:1230 start_codon:yes stop_codon:yes gene_type:complete